MNTRKDEAMLHRDVSRHKDDKQFMMAPETVELERLDARGVF